MTFPIKPLVLLLSAAITSQVFAQTSVDDMIRAMRHGNESSSSSSSIQNAPIQSSQISASMAPSQGSNAPGGKDVLVDKPIDPALYRIGSGDEITIYLWGSTEKTFQLKVNAEGRVLIPQIGSATIGGLLLKDAKDTIHARVLSAFKNVHSDIFLSEIRKLKSGISGEVSHPGVYVTTGVMRISELIRAAGGLTDSANSRRIMLVGPGADTQYVDLCASDRTGDPVSDPYLLEGERVIVIPRTNIIMVSGAVHYQGTLDYIAGENLLDVIRVCGGTTRGADSSKIMVSRFVDNNDSLSTFELTFADAANFAVSPDDRIFACLQPKYRQARNVKVVGEVKFPGTYPIRDDKTRLVDVIAMAGGLTQDAYLRGSKMIRHESTNTGEREYARLRTVPAANLTPLERSYLKTIYGKLHVHSRMQAILKTAK